MDHEDFDARIKTNDLIIECSHRKVGFLIEILMTVINPVVMEKHEFEYQDETLFVALFGKSGFLCF